MLCVVASAIEADFWAQRWSVHRVESDAKDGKGEVSVSVAERRFQDPLPTSDSDLQLLTRYDRPSLFSLANVCRQLVGGDV